MYHNHYDMDIQFKVEEIVKNLDIQAVRKDERNSVLVEDKYSGIGFWVDVSIECDCGYIYSEWNQYIFDTTNDADSLKMALQSNLRISEAVFNAAESFLIESGTIVINESGCASYVS